MKLLQNEEAVSLTVGYVLFSIIFVGFYAMVLLSSDKLFIEGPSNIVVKEQFRDIGNMLSTKITDIYIISPENGIIETSYMIPSEIGKETYIIDAEPISMDQIIEVRSIDSDKSVSVTISGIASSLNGTATSGSINGTAYSSTPEHMIRYDSTK